MPLATHTLSGDLSALIGERDKVSATIHLNTEDGNWVNETDGTIILGSGRLYYTRNGGTGQFTVTLPTSTGTGLRYEVRVDYTDETNKVKPNQSWRSGWFPLTANATLAERAVNSTVYVSQSKAAAILEEVSGYTDHGNVSGTVTFNAPTGTHAFDATAPTTVTLDGYTNGQSVALVCYSGASDVTVTDAGDLELADGLAIGMLRSRDSWVTGGGGGEPAVPDTTPPSAITGLTATGGEGQVTFNWNAATDAESPVKYGWKVWLTSGSEPGSYTTRTTVGPVTVTGLAAGAYTVKVYSFSTGGSTVAVTTSATVTAALAVDFLDTFARANGPLSSASTPDTGSAWGGSTAGPQITSGKLVSAGGHYVYAARTNPAREFNADVVTTNTSTIVLGAWADGATSGGDLVGPRLAILTNGQLSFQNVTGVTYNVTGGTNPYTPTGYLSEGAHTVKIETRADGTCHAYIDGTLVVSAAYNTSQTGRHVAVMLTGTIDNIQVKS